MVSDKIDDTMDYDSNNKDKAFDNWFHNYLLHRTASCLDRDILRWAKPVLRVGFFEQMNSEDNELAFRGAKKYLDLEAKLKQRDELLREACEKLQSYNKGFKDCFGLDKSYSPKTDADDFLSKPEIKQIMESQSDDVQRTLEEDNE